MNKIDDIDETDYESYLHLISKNYLTAFPSHLQNKFSTDFDDFREGKTTLQHLLKDLKIYSTNELRYHTFPLFIRNKDCHKLLKNFLDNDEVITDRSKVYFSYTDEDFNYPVVKDLDFDFMKFLLKDGEHWELLGVENDTKVNTYWCDQSFLPNVSFLKGSYTVKYEYILDFPFEKVAPSVLSMNQREKNDDTILRIKTLNYIPSNTDKDEEVKKTKRSHSVMRYDLYVNMFMNVRLWYPVTSMKYDPETETLTHVVKSCKLNSKIDFMDAIDSLCVSEKGGSESTQKCYLIFNFLSTSIKKLSDESTLFTQLNIVNIGGWGTNSYLLKYFSHDRSLKVHKMLLKTIKSTDFTLKELSKECEKHPEDTYLKMLSEIDF
eukprot:gene2532-3495_t